MMFLRCASIGVNTMQTIYITLFVLLLLGLLFLISRGARTRYPYRQREQLFTPAEWHFYQALRAAVPEELLIFGKVRVADVLQPEKGLDRSTWQRAFNKIAGKHIDFVLVEAHTGHVCCAIELNDRSHQRRDRQDRDAFLVGACEHAELPLLMIPAARQYDIAALRHHIQSANAREERFLAQAPDGFPLPDTETHCPQCGSPLVEKVARRGRHAGRVFLSCADFPRCRFARTS